MSVNLSRNLAESMFTMTDQFRPSEYYFKYGILLDNFEDDAARVSDVVFAMTEGQVNLHLIVLEVPLFPVDKTAYLSTVFIEVARSRILGYLEYWTVQEI